MRLSKDQRVIMQSRYKLRLDGYILKLVLIPAYAGIFLDVVIK